MNPASRNSSKSPWGWIPTVYFAEGLPYFAVNVLTVIMFTNMGIPKDTMAFYTGLLYLPWVIKPFWSPFVDLVKTKRWWTLAMQILICLTMTGVALAVSASAFFFTSLVFFWIMAFASANHDIAADGFYMLALDSKQQAAYVGVRSTFYRISSVVGQGGLVMIAGAIETKYHNVSLAWSVTFWSLAIFFLLIFLWNTLQMPKPATDAPKEGVKYNTILREFFETFSSFFRKKHVGIALCFMLLYRLPEALCLKLIQPFLLDPRDAGGLALSTAEVGFVNGTVGVIALLGGGILGGLCIASGSLRKWLWPMGLSLTLPCAIYCIFAIYQPQNLWFISAGLAIEQFGYGFGFTAYMLYMMKFSIGECQTSHYAFCTAFMALGMMLPGMLAGWLYNQCEAAGNFMNLGISGYFIFFSIILITSLATFVSIALVRPTLKNE